MSKDKIVHVTFIVKRHPEHKKDLACRYNSLKIVEKSFNKFMIPLNTSIRRQTPISDSTIGVSIDEKDLTTFRIDVAVQNKNDNENEIIETIGNVIKQLKAQNRPRPVLAYTETKQNN